MNQNLTTRKSAIDLIQNIRQVRHVVKTGTFDRTMFDSINGNDYALEALCGREVYFDVLDDSGKQKLRREILSKLTENETKAFDMVRTSLVEYFKDIDKALAHERNFAPIEASAETIEKAQALSGGYAKDQVIHACHCLEAATDFVSRVSPVLARVLADQEEIGEEEAAEQSGSEAAPDEKIEPNPPETDESEIGHQVYTDPKKEDEIVLPEIEKVAASNKALEANLDQFIEGGPITKMGYDSLETINATLTLIDSTRKEFLKAVKSFRDVLPVATCTSDDLNKGSDSFFSAVDAVKTFVDKGLAVLDALESTGNSLSNIVR